MLGLADIKWIKLTVNVFDDEKFDVIKTLPDSSEMQLAWIKLLCLAGICNENGLLVLTNEIPYTDEMLAKRFDMDVGVVQRALSIFRKLEMVEVIDNVYMVSNWQKYQSGEELERIREKSRERQRRFREKQIALIDQRKEEVSTKCNVTDNVTGNVKNNVNCSISISNSFSFKDHLNIENLKYILDKNIYKDSIYILNKDNLYKEILEWMAYKDEKRPKAANHYDTERSLKKFLTIVVDNDKEYGTDAVIRAIDYSIANNYQGIVWDRLSKERNKEGQRKVNLKEWHYKND